MKSMKFILFMSMALFLGGATGCDEAKENIRQNSGTYIGAGGKIYKIAKDIDIDKNATGVETAKGYVDSAAKMAGVLRVIPAAAPIAEIAVGVLGLIGTGLGFWVRNEKKKVKVVTERAVVAEKKSDNYREGINAAISNGDNQDVAEVKVLKEVLDTDTKLHFNAEGIEKL